KEQWERRRVEALTVPEADSIVLHLSRSQAGRKIGHGQGWARNRAMRATLVDLSEEERQELWETFQVLVQSQASNKQDTLDWTGVVKAADTVLGAGKYRQVLGPGPGGSWLLAMVVPPPPRTRSIRRQQEGSLDTNY
ncbi:hypothetical protein HaLaN_25242, partial [Haematococcus lacustris]